MYGYVAQVPLFRTLPTIERRRISHVAELRRFKKGKTIFEEGNPAESVWVVKQGWVYLVKRTPQGGRATIFTMTPDEALCGVSAFDHGTYSAAAIAATDTQLITVPAELFSRLLDRYPKFAKQVLLTCCLRMRHMAETISLSQEPVEKRIAYVLLRLRASFNNAVPITHQELARMAGTRLETSIRTIAIFKRHGWLSTSRGKMTIRRSQPLKALLHVRYQISPQALREPDS